MRCRFVLIPVLLAAMAGCNSQKAALDHYLEGQLALDHGNTDEAMRVLTKAIAENPQLGAAWLSRGIIQKNKGNFTKAATDLEHAAALDPKDFDANYQLGSVYQYLNRLRDAIVSYQKAVEIRPLNPDVNMGLAQAYVDLKEPLRALQYAQRAVDGDPDNAAAQAGLGMLYSQLESSDDPATAQRHSDNAVTALRKSIDLNSKRPEAYIALGNEYLRRQSFPLAKNVLEAASRLPAGPHSAAVEERLGLAWYKLNNIDKAEECYNASLTAQYNYVPALNGLGVMHMARAVKSDPPNAEQARQAMALWQRSLTIDSNQPSIQALIDRYKPHE